MVHPQLRAVWCKVSLDNINFNGHRAVMEFAKYYIGFRIEKIYADAYSYLHRPSYRGSFRVRLTRGTQ